MEQKMEPENKDLLKLKFQEETKRLREEREMRIRERWENLGTFEKPTDIPEIPKVDEEEYKAFYLPRLIKAGAIQKKDLVDGNCYLGDHRNCTIARWNEKENVFEYWRYKWGAVYIDTCNHFEDDDGFALFVPIKLVTTEEFDKTGIK